MSDNGITPRYAIYFSPAADTPLLRLGNEWLGRDPATNAVLTPENSAPLERSEWLRVTETAAKYGFHATLKPPFRLADESMLPELRQEMKRFADAEKSFYAPHLRVSTLGRFLALVLSESSPAFAVLAAKCVVDFDRFRGPETEVERAKRMHDSLAQAEQENLIRWGYPYVMDTWKFHMTLTCSLEQKPLARFRAHLESRFAPVCTSPIEVDAISLFEENGPGTPFRLVERFGFA
jgi:putative phosphonate metabolism protein